MPNHLLTVETSISILSLVSVTLLIDSVFFLEIKNSAVAAGISVVCNLEHKKYFYCRIPMESEEADL